MQALVPNDYYDLLEEDEDEIDEDYVVESSRYSLADLALSEVSKSSKVKPHLTSNDDQFWIQAIEKSATVSDPDSKNLIGTKLKSAKSIRNQKNVSAEKYWIAFITHLNTVLDPFARSQFNHRLKSNISNNDLMKKIIFSCAADRIKNSIQDKITVGSNGDFPTIDFKLISNRTLNTSEIVQILNAGDNYQDVLRQKISKDLENYRKIYETIVIVNNKVKKSLFEDLIDKNLASYVKQIRYYLTSNPQPPPSKSESPQASPARTPADETEFLSAYLDLDSDNVTPTPTQDNDEDASTSSLAQDSDSDGLEPLMTPPTEPKNARKSTSISSPQTSSTSPSSSNKNSKEERPFIDEFFDDPIFDNPFVKMFIKRPGDEHVGLPDFYRYFKNKNKKNESFDLSLRDRKLSHYLIEEGITDAIYDVATDVVGDLAASTASIGTFGITSAAFILKNIYELKETSKKADIAIEAFLLDPSDKTCDNIEKILSDIITDFIDLVQRTIEMIPDPAGDVGTSTASIIQNVLKFAQQAKTFLQADTLLGKIQKIGKVNFILKPFIKIILGILESEKAPEEIKNDNRFILGTLNKMVLIIDLTEDYYIQKKAAEAAGIKDFQYQHKVFQKSGSFDDYDPETSHARKSPEEREREYTEEISSSDSDFFQESLRHKSLAYLLSESEDDAVDEEVEQEGEELEEFSGAGAVAGFSLPLGASPRGPGGAHSSTSGGRAYPYSTSDRSKFNKFSKKTFGGK